MTKKTTYIGLIIIGAAALAAIPAFAATPGISAPSAPSRWHGKAGTNGGNWQNMPRPAVTGTVTAVNGTSITLSGFAPLAFTPGSTPLTKPAVKPTPTTFTVDASNATVSRGFGTSTTAIAVSAIATGDRLAVFGTLSGTSVTATKISDIPAGTMPFGFGPQGNHGLGGPRSSNPKMVPGTVAFGSVTAVNGSDLTIQQRAFRNQATTTETVVTTSATTFKKNGQAATLADISVGNLVMANGTTTAADTLTANTVRILTPRQKSSQK